VGVLVVEERPSAGLPCHHAPCISEWASGTGNEWDRERVGQGTSGTGNEWDREREEAQDKAGSLEGTILVLVDELEQFAVGPDAALAQLS
jgi:hypothetical protein